MKGGEKSDTPMITFDKHGPDRLGNFVPSGTSGAFFLHGRKYSGFHVPARGPQLFRITSMALGITWNHCWNQGINRRFLNRESQFLRFVLDI